MKSLLFNTLPRFVIDFLSRSKHPLISRLPPPSALSAVILESKKIKCGTFPLFPFYLPWSDGAGCPDLRCFHVEFQASFFTPLSPSSRGSLVFLHFLSIICISEVVDISPHPRNLDSNLWFLQPNKPVTCYKKTLPQGFKMFTFNFYSSLTRKKITVKICPDRLGAINLPKHHRFGPDGK